MAHIMMTKKQKIPVFGYAAGIAANNPDCRLGPATLKQSSFLNEKGLNLAWEELLNGGNGSDKLAALKEVSKLTNRLAKQVEQWVSEQQKFLVLGGDHSAAIGTWSGAASALRPKGSLGLMWIDAHMDSHTPETTESGNIHGMPLACLLGFGPDQLTALLESQPKVLPWHICLIGVRSFEQGEAELLKRLNVQIFFMDEVKQRGLAAVFADGLRVVEEEAVGYGISVDLAAMDSIDAPGVGKPEPVGLAGKELCQQLQIVKNDPKLLGLEIVEFNPLLDKDKRTERLVADMIAAVFS